MYLTPFGYLFLPIVLAALAFRRSWLFPLLIISAALHAPAVAIIGASETSKGMGITPWLTVSCAIFIHLILIVKERRRIEIGESVWVRRLFIGWTVFFAWGVVSAFTLPFLFEGVMTYSTANRAGIEGGLTPLRWHAFHAVQALNTGIIWMLFVYVLQVANSAGFVRRVFAGFALAAFMAVSFSLLQRGLTLYQQPVPAWISDSLNPSYVQTMGYGLGKIYRLNWPFSEPSYASVWFAGIYAGGLGMVLFSAAPLGGALLSLIGITGVANSLGGSGMASAIVMTAGLLLVCVYLAVRADPARRTLYLRRGLTVVLAVLALLGTGLSLKSHSELKTVSVQNIYRSLIVPRLNDVERKGNTRSQSNREALRIVKETWGLGAGMGSNRTSSHAVNMLASVGIPGAVLFFMLMVWQTARLGSADRRSPVAHFLQAGLAGALAGCAIGIPDLNWPGFWIWLVAGLGLAAVRPAAQASRASTA